MCAETSEDEIGGDRASLIEPCFSKRPLDIDNTEGAMGLDALVPGAPACFGCEHLGHVCFCAARLAAVEQCGPMINHWGVKCNRGDSRAASLNLGLPDM